MAGFLMGSSSPLVINFNDETQLIINHGLGYRPMIYIITGDGKIVTGEITHNSITRITINFVIAISGSVFLR